MKRYLQIAGAVLGAMASSCYRPGPAEPDAEPVEVTVMSFNILHDGARSGWHIPGWEERKASVLETVRAADPDVVGLQEAHMWQVNQDLLAGLSGYQAVGAGTSGGDDGESVTILFREDRFRLESSGHFWLSDAPDTPGSVGGDGWGEVDVPRMVTWVELAMREDGRTFYVYNTHLLDGSSAADARRESALLIARRIADRAHPEAPFFLTGDFNATEDEFPVQYLLNVVSCADCSISAVAPVKVIDTWRALHSGDGGTRCQNDESGRRRDVWSPRVDYVFVQDAAAEGGGGRQHAVLSSEVVLESASCPSDHLPVVATVALQSGG